MTVQVRGLAVFTATGVAGSLAQVASTVPSKIGDPVIDAWDITSPAQVAQFFSNALIGPPGGGAPSIAEVVANAALAGHVIVALIGIGPSG